MGNRMSELRERADRTQLDLERALASDITASAVKALRDMVEETYACARNAQIVAQDAQNRADPGTLRRITDADRQEVRKLERRIDALESRELPRFAELKGFWKSPPVYQAAQTCEACFYGWRYDGEDCISLRCGLYHVDVDSQHVCADYKKGE